MLDSRSKTVASILATVVLAAGLPDRAVAVEGQAGGSKGPTAADSFAVDKRIQEILPTPKEKRFEEIGWVGGIREAERLARENDRPVFLFVNVGRMDLGRC